MGRFGIVIIVLLWSWCCQARGAEIELSPKVVYELLSLRIDNIIRETNILKFETENLKSELIETKAVVNRIEQNIDHIGANITLMATKSKRNEIENSKSLLTEYVHAKTDESRHLIQEKLRTESAVLRRTLVNEKTHLRQAVLTIENKFKDFQSDVAKHLTLINDSMGRNIESLEHSFDEHKVAVDSRLSIAVNEMEISLNETDILIQEIDVDSKIKQIDKALVGNISNISQRLSTVNFNLNGMQSRLNGRLKNAESQLRTMSSKQERQEDMFSGQISSLSSRISKEEARKIAFSARQTKKHDHYGKNEVIVFDSVIYSYGGGYSFSTGIFTAPESGTYLFTYNIQSSNKGLAHVVLSIDGKITTRAIANKGTDSTGGNAGIAYVWKGSKVWLQTSSLRDKYYIWPYRTTFNGILID